jgi:hypothetical protein
MAWFYSAPWPTFAPPLTLGLRFIKVAARIAELKTMIRIQWPTACPD